MALIVPPNAPHPAPGRIPAVPPLMPHIDARSMPEQLCPREFRLSRLSSLAVLTVLVHQLLFSTAERFRFRAYVLQRGFGTATRFLLRSTERIRARTRRADPEWDRIAAARADLRTLSTLSLQTFHALLTSLSVEPR